MAMSGLPAVIYIAIGWHINSYDIYIYGTYLILSYAAAKATSSCFRRTAHCRFHSQTTVSFPVVIGR